MCDTEPRRLWRKRPLARRRDAGARHAEAVRQAERMQQGDEVTRAAGQDEQVPDGMGLLRISAPVSFGTRRLGPMLFAFMRAHPHLEHALDLSDGMVDIAAEGDDLAIRITRLPPMPCWLRPGWRRAGASSAAVRTARAMTACRRRSMTSPITPASAMP